MASFAALTGVELPQNGALDSFNILDAILGKPNAIGREHIVSQDNGKRGTYGL